MPSIKRYLPIGLKRVVKENVAALFNIPMSRYDVPLSLMKVLPRIEPPPKRIETMKAKLPGDRFSFACAAVSNEESKIEMDVLNWDYSSSILPVRRDLATYAGAIDLGVRERIQVQVSTLDNLCATHHFDEFIDLPKIDVQGAEALALAGTTNVLRRTWLIWMELSLQPLYEGCVTIEGMIQLYRDHGFRLRDLQEGFFGSDGELLQLDGLFSSK